MTKQLPKSKFVQLADIMRERIASGEWTHALPPERFLAEEFLVSRTTLRRALAILTDEKLLLPVVSRRGQRLIQAAAPRRVGRGLKRVCILTPTLHGSPQLIEQLGVMRLLLGNAGIAVDVDEAGLLIDQQDPSSTLSRILRRHANSIWVLHKMPEQVQRWFERERLPTVVFGSVFPGVSLPGVDLDFRAAARHATGLLLARGCRHLVLLVHRTPLAGDSKTVEAVTGELTRHGLPAPRVLRHDSNRMRLMDALDREIVARLGECDALIIANDHHLLTALPHLMRRGVRIPEDISLIHLSNDPAVERLSPLPYRYEPGSLRVRRLVAAVKTLFDGGSPKSSLLIPELLEGESLRSAAAGSGKQR